jgi:hypothetical protein
MKASIMFSNIGEQENIFMLEEDERDHLMELNNLQQVTFRTARLNLIKPEDEKRINGVLEIKESLATMKAIAIYNGELPLSPLPED